MTILDGDSLLDTLGFEIERVSQIHDGVLARRGEFGPRAETVRDI